jgi:hypothetical protein
VRGEEEDEDEEENEKRQGNFSRRKEWRWDSRSDWEPALRGPKRCWMSSCSRWRRSMG